MIFIILQGSRVWVSQSLPSMESLWIPEKTFGICEFPSHTSMAWLQDLQLIFLLLLLLLLLWVHSQIVQFDTNSITTSNTRPSWSYATHVSLSCTHKEPLHMQIHTSVSVVWICAWWHHNELLHHTAHFILTIRYTGFKAFHTKYPRNHVLYK
jgi:hypothetical protein